MGLKKKRKAGSKAEEASARPAVGLKKCKVSSGQKKRKTSREPQEASVRPAVGLKKRKASSGQKKRNASREQETRAWSEGASKPMAKA